MNHDCPPQFLHNDDINYETLRRARVHLDMTVNVMFRFAFKGFDFETTWFYLFADASPQHLGVELYAASFETFTFGLRFAFKRRLFTQIQIGRCMYSALGKATALLWQIVLQVGHDYWNVRQFCNNVAGLCTDMGTERKLADHADIVIPFLRSLKVRIPSGAVSQRYLFPAALPSVGWFHLWDGIICHGLCSMPWWPHFLRCLRGLVHFVRDERESICNAFLKAGLAGTKALLFILRIPVFISWRWGSIWDVVRESKFAVNVFRTHSGVVLTVLATMTDGSLAAKVKEAMYSDEWFRNFSFTYWFSEKLCYMQAWGASCICHQQEFLDRTPVDCIHKGRILPIAKEFVAARLAEFLQEVNDWIEETWGGGRPFLRGVVAMCRGVHRRAKQRTSFIDEIPFIFARLGRDPEIPTLAIQQFDSVPEAQHNKVSIEVCGKDSELRADLLAMPDPYTLTLSLESVRDRVSHMSFLDKIAEGPHAIF